MPSLISTTTITVYETGTILVIHIEIIILARLYAIPRIRSPILFIKPIFTRQVD